MSKTLFKIFSGVASSKPLATSVVGIGGLAVSRPIATAISGLDPYEVAELGIPIKKTQKTKTQALTNYEIANNIKKTYGLSNDGNNKLIGPLIQRNQFEVQTELEKSEDDMLNSSEKTSVVMPPVPVKQVGMMLQPDLDPYSLIPQQYHNSFNIKPHHMIISRHGSTEAAKEIDNTKFNQDTLYSQDTQKHTRTSNLSFLPSYYSYLPFNQ